MAGGRSLAPAIDDLATLPRDAYERTVAERILLDLQHVLGQQSNPNPEEQQFMVTMRRSWEDARAEGRAEGHAEGRAEGQAEAVIAVLRSRGISVPDAARKRILAQKDPQRLQQWLDKAVIATSVEDVIGQRFAARTAKTGRTATSRERSGRKPARAAQR
jgi:hypothetical protein